MTKIALDGHPCSTNVELPGVGDIAPDFSLVDAQLRDVSLADFAGRKKLISIVPSLYTGVCATTTKKFDELAAQKPGALMLIVSADLPFAQARFCGTENTGRIQTLSMMRSRRFAKDYGVLIQDGPFAGIAARAVLVLDENNKVLYSELVPDIGQEPDYDAALAALD